MKQKYYVNRKPQANGDHEVHVSTCKYMPDLHNCEYLGEFDSCEAAVREAKKKHTKTNGCYFCCNPCHTR